MYVTSFCVGIAHEDIASIFEEHRLCKNSNMLQCKHYQEAMGIYIQDENKFVFNNVLVGQSAKVRFHLTNRGKIPCKLSLQVKTVLNKVCLCVTAANANMSCLKTLIVFIEYCCFRCPYVALRCLNWALLGWVSPVTHMPLLQLPSLPSTCRPTLECLKPL